ncbi:C25 family cysteine peptidase [Pseudomonadota bacterium]
MKLLQTSVVILFLSFLPALSHASGDVSGIIYEDVNGNATQDAGEPGLPDIDVFLFEDDNCDGIPNSLTPFATTTSNAVAPLGTYSFANIADGCWLVGVSLNEVRAEQLPDGGRSTPFNRHGFSIDGNNDHYTRGNIGFVDAPLQNIEHTAPNAVSDNNKADEGPDVFTVGTQVCNNTTTPLENVVVDISFPVTDCTTTTNTCTVGSESWTTSNPNNYWGRNYQLELTDVVISPPEDNDKHRVIGQLPAEDFSTIIREGCVGVFWQVKYELEDAPGGNRTHGNATVDDDLRYQFTITSSVNTDHDPGTIEPSFTINDTVTLRNQQNTGTTRIQPSSCTWGDPDFLNGGCGTYVDLGSGFQLVSEHGTTSSPLDPPIDVTIGQIVKVRYEGVEVANLNQGFDANGDGFPDYDLWHQPISSVDVDPDIFRLLEVDTLFQLDCTQPEAGNPKPLIATVDNLYITEIDAYGNCSGVHGAYTYTYIVIGGDIGDTQVTSPYLEHASGAENEKYNNDFCNDPTTNTGLCVEFRIAAGGAEIDKLVKAVPDAADPTGFVDTNKVTNPPFTTDPVTLEYQLEYNNNSSVTIGEPLPNAVILYDEIPGIDTTDPDNTFTTFATYVSNSAEAACTTLDASYGVSTPGCDVRFSTDGYPVGDYRKIWRTQEPADVKDITHLAFVMTDQVPASGNGRITFQLEIREIVPPAVGDPDPLFNGIVVNNADVRIDSGKILDEDDATTCIRAFVDDCAFSTLAMITGFGAYAQSSGGIAVWWESGYELGTAGYYVERQDPDSKQFSPIHNDMLMADLSGVNGAQYQIADPGVSTGASYVYRLIEVELNGHRIEHGPYTVDITTDGSLLNVVTAQPVSSNFGSLVSGFVTQKRATPEWQKTRNELRKASKAKSKQNKSNNKQNNIAKSGKSSAVQAAVAADAIKVGIKKPGLHYVDVGAYGFNPSQVMVTNRGQQVATTVAGDGTGIHFYAEGIDSQYTLENIYRISAGNGAKMAQLSGKKPKNIGSPSATYRSQAHIEKDAVPATNYFEDPESDYWFYPLTDVVIAGLGEVPFSVPTPGANASSSGQLTVNLQGGTDAAAGDDHHVLIKLNGTLLGSSQWDGIAPQAVSVNVPAGLLNDGDNSVTLAGVLGAGVPFGFFLADSFDIEYDRSYVAENNRLFFEGAGHGLVTVAGFDTNDISIFNISNPLQPQIVSAVKISAIGSGYGVSLVPDSATSKYLAISGIAVLSPASIEQDLPSNLSDPTTQGEYIVITSDEFAESAQRLADYRSGQGYAVVLAKMSDIHDEFNHGIASPHAITDFIKYAYENWQVPPKAAVLTAAASFDYRNLQGFGDSIVPTLMSGTPHGLFAADNRFGNVSGGPAPEVAIGRLPAVLKGELDEMIDKIIAYEADSGEGWSDKVSLVSDDADSGGNNFRQSNEESADLIPASYKPLDKVYLDDLLPNQAQARQDTRDAFSEGRLLINYYGHGNTDEWASEKMLTVNDVANMNNGSKLPIVASMTCNIGRFEFTGHASLGEALILRANGGAAAVWAPTGQSYNTEAEILNKAFVSGLFAPGDKNLGDVVLGALQEMEDNGTRLYILNIYALLGDPFLRIRTHDAP